MCGIAGFVSTSGIGSSVLFRMNNLAKHRGPDDEGYVVYSTNNDKLEIFKGDDTDRNALAHPSLIASKHIVDDNGSWNVGFGHRRLSIIDLSANGHVPMSDESGRYWITYNGEVYNFLELKDELIKLGIGFTTDSDTEVVLKAFIQWDVKAFQKFKGMWALAIFDRAKKRVLLCRDRFGIKPLYYIISKEGDFFFSSEIKQFAPIPGWKNEINPAKVIDFLASGIADHTSETMFKNVKQVLHGELITVEFSERGLVDLNISNSQWYTLGHQVSKSRAKRGNRDLFDEFRQRFSTSIAQHLRSDVPLGFCLSGGLDSTAIVSEVDFQQSIEQHPAQLQVFTVLSDDPRYNEEKWVNEVLSNKKSLKGHSVVPSMNELFHQLDKIIWHQDEPFQSSSILLQWSIFKLVKDENIKVVLDGQGADEQLGGYSGFFIFRLSSLLKRLNLLEYVKEVNAISSIHRIRKAELLKNTLINLIPQKFRQQIFTKSRIPKWLNFSKLVKKVLHPHINLKSSTCIREESIKQLSGGNLQRLLHWEDRNSMAFSIESRVPFLDHELVEFSIALPDYYKIYRGITKGVMREACRDILPKAIYTRTDKIGFMPAEEIWMRENAQIIRSQLEMAVNDLNGLVNDYLPKEFDDFIARRKDFSFEFWRVICLWRWTKVFGVVIP
jgi:asparagine synthase (glutamine-hydrolysing)